MDLRYILCPAYVIILLVFIVPSYAGDKSTNIVLQGKHNENLVMSSGKKHSNIVMKGGHGGGSLVMNQEKKHSNIIMKGGHGDPSTIVMNT